MSTQFQKLLFVMPDDEETYIAAVAALSAYTAKLYSANMRLDVNLVGRRTWLSDLLVPPAFRMHDSVESAGVGYDLAVELTQERAAQLANATSQSCATGFGTLLGFEGVNELARMRPLPEPEHDIGVLWWGKTADKFCDAAKRMDPDLNLKRIMPIIWKPRSAGISMAALKLVYEDSCQDALNCRLLVGMRSPLTYFAACAGRAVIELYPVDEYEKSFFAKWSAQRYWCMLLESRNAIDANYPTLWRSFERIWRQLGKQRRLLQPAPGQ